MYGKLTTMKYTTYVTQQFQQLFRFKPIFSIILLAGISATISSCSSSNSQDIINIKVDGSSTVYPITEEFATDYNLRKNAEKSGSPVTVTVNFSGTSRGFKKFCNGETDINNASRPIHTHEIKDCNQNGVRFFELPIGFDAVTMVVNSQNTWAKDITVAELKKIWQPSAEGKITKWNQVRSTWPDKPLNLYGSGSDSGTFDYFTEVVVGTEYSIRKDYKADSDYRKIAQQISADGNGLAFIPYAYYKSNRDTLKALAVDSGSGAVAPSIANVKWGKYRPFSRPIFIYVSYESLGKKPVLREVVELYMDKAPEFVSAVGYVPLTDQAYKLNYIHFHQAKFGTVFEGKSQYNLTLEQVLKKQGKF